MDSDSYEQYTLADDAIEEDLLFISEGIEGLSALDELDAGHVPQEEADEKHAGLAPGKGQLSIPASGTGASEAQIGCASDDGRHELTALIVTFHDPDLNLLLSSQL